jgi:glucose-1-phosphate cytidylyltransferase
MTPASNVKAVIFAGGKGSRLSEETVSKPKPMVEVGGRPLLWHIMKLYSHHGIRDFIVCLGWKGDRIKEYFFLYSLLHADVTIETRGGMTLHGSPAEDWRVTLVNTGEETMTGGRLQRIRRYLGDDPVFCLTYGDGVADVDITASLAFHRSHGKLATVTAVRPMARFGSLDMGDDGRVRRFVEKPVDEGGLINGGFFVLSPKVIDYVAGDATLWEKEPLESLARDGQLMAFVHSGFWQPVDTLRDRNRLEDLWATGKPPWRVWE